MSQTEPFCSVSRLDAEFLHELAVLVEHLDAVVGAVADVHQAVVGQPHAVHRVANSERGAAGS